MTSAAVDLGRMMTLGADATTETPNGLAAEWARRIGGARPADDEPEPLRVLAPTMLHALVDGAVAGRQHDRYAPCGRQDLERLGHAGDLDGHSRVARIVDAFGHGQEEAVLARLEHAAPGAAGQVRARMFTFADLAGLAPAAIQTLLASIDRDRLAYALKGAPADIANVIFSNLTRHAGALIREEMDALGPVRRSDVDAARREILDTARRLIRRGDIDAGQVTQDDELVE